MSGAIILTLNPHDRIGIATTIERLINMLDALEPDADLEDGGDLEPLLGWTGEGRGAVALDPTVNHGDDREEQCDDEGAEDSDLEPNGDEIDFDGGEHDADVFIWGGGEDGAKPLMPGYN